MPESHVEAFERWDRRGSPQVRHSHAFLGRLYGLIRDHAPDLLAKFLACGAEELRVMDQARRRIAPDAPAEPGDDDLVLLACRRITFEYLLRRHVLDSGRVAFRDGDDVTGLVAAPANGGPLRVTGVRVSCAGGRPEELAADLVVDASGRRSKLSD